MSDIFKRVILSLVFAFPGSGHLGAVDLTPSQGGGPTPQQLADSIADQANGVTVVAGSATTTINASGNPVSDARAFGSFVNGNTPAGTPLPNENGGPAATYAGGIDIDSGVCNLVCEVAGVFTPRRCEKDRNLPDRLRTYA